MSTEYARNKPELWQFPKQTVWRREGDLSPRYAGDVSTVSRKPPFSFQFLRRISKELLWQLLGISFKQGRNTFPVYQSAQEIYTQYLSHSPQFF